MERGPQQERRPARLDAFTDEAEGVGVIGSGGSREAEPFVEMSCKGISMAR